jgi:hypothetical protein
VGDSVGAKKTVAALNGSDLGGRTIQVNEARPNSRVVTRGVTPALSAVDLLVGLGKLMKRNGATLGLS